MTDDIGSETDGCDWGDRRSNARFRLVPERVGDPPQCRVPAACLGSAAVADRGLKRGGGVATLHLATGARFWNA